MTSATSDPFGGSPVPALPADATPTAIRAALIDEVHVLHLTWLG
jgi:hypothetical protein